MQLLLNVGLLPTGSAALYEAQVAVKGGTQLQASTSGSAPLRELDKSTFINSEAPIIACVMHSWQL